MKKSGEKILIIIHDRETRLPRAWGMAYSLTKARAEANRQWALWFAKNASWATRGKSTRHRVST